MSIRRILSGFVVSFSLAVAVGACTSTLEAPLCTDNAQCGAGDVCLSIGACATQCVGDDDCDAGQKCSAAGGCVAQDGCGDNYDCADGQGCNAAGVCSSDFIGNNGGPGGIGGPGGGTGGPVSVPAKECGAQLFGNTPVEANFFIVMDHSGSMQEEVGGQQKWTSATQAVKTITAQHDGKIRFGLQLFSSAQQRCDPGKIDLDIGANQAATIASLLPAVADGDRTPVAGALAVTVTAPGLKDATRSNNVLLVTDGKENCGGNPVARTQDLFQQNVKTYVVGFGGEVDRSNLSEMAVAGGTARPGATQYYQADDPAGLNAAFAQIAQGALGCDLKLSQVPQDSKKIFLFVNGAQQPRDANRQNGWDYLADVNRVVLYGTTCTLVTNDPNATINVVYGCPDESLVETPGGGGNVGKPAGAACVSNAACASGACTNGRCQGSPGNAPCTSNGQCNSGVCNAGFCEGSGPPTRPGGAVCVTNGQCASGACVAGFCSGGALPGGAACTEDSACASNECTNGFCESVDPSNPPAGSGNNRPNGSACASNSECASGVCTDDVCRPGAIN